MWCNTQQHNTNFDSRYVVDSKYIILSWIVYRLGGHWWEYSIGIVGIWLYVISTYYYIIIRKIRRDIFSWDFISKFTAVRFVIVEDIDLTFLCRWNVY